MPHCYLAIHSAVLFSFEHVYSSYRSKILLSYFWFSRAAACESLCHSSWVPGGVIRWRCTQCSAVTLPESLAEQSHGKLQVGLSKLPEREMWLMLHVETWWCSTQAEELPYHWRVCSLTAKTAATLPSKAITVWKNTVTKAPGLLSRVWLCYIPWKWRLAGLAASAHKTAQRAFSSVRAMFVCWFVF